MIFDYLIVHLKDPCVALHKAYYSYVSDAMEVIMNKVKDAANYALPGAGSLSSILDADGPMEMV